MSWQEHTEIRMLESVVLNNQNQLKTVGDEFVSFYNYERINKDGLTPYEFRSKTI